MAFIPVPDAAMAVQKFSHDGQSWSNTLWFTKAGFVTADMDALAAAVGTTVISYLKPFISLNATYDGVTVYDMRTATGEKVEYNNGSGAGLDTDAIIPTNVALVLTLYSNNRGRSGRGRVYLSGFDETAIDDGRFLAQWGANVATWAAELETAVEAEGWTWVVVSRYTAGAPRASGLAQAVTSTAVRSLIPGTQRRRLDRN